jgi:hypothetical protein
MTAKRARRARKDEVDPEILAWFEDRGPAPNSVKYFMDHAELLALWEHREKMSRSALAEFRAIARVAGVDLGG